MSSNVIHGGFRFKRRIKEDRENKILRCEVSERWIQLPDATDLANANADIDYMTLKVMTNGSNNEPRNLCELVVNRSMLIEILKDIPIVDHRGTDNE